MELSLFWEVDTILGGQECTKACPMPGTFAAIIKQFVIGATLVAVCVLSLQFLAMNVLSLLMEECVCFFAFVCVFEHSLFLQK